MDGGYKLEGDFYTLTEEGYGEFFHRIYDQDFEYKKGDIVLVYGEEDGNYRFTLDQENLDYTIRGKIPKDKVKIIETNQETKEVIDFKQNNF